MEKLRVAIIGTGGISHAHIRAWKKMPDCQVIACCDLDGDKARHFAQDYDIPSVYTDCAELMAREKPDCVSVCTWNSAHAPVTITALRGGAHVLCEKPMALNAREAREMADVARETGKLLQIGFVRRFGHDADAVCRLAQAGMLGKIYYGKTYFLRRSGSPGGWFQDKAYAGGGPMMDIGVHMIDLCKYLAGNPKPVSVYAAAFSGLDTCGALGDAPDWAIETGASPFKHDVEDMAAAMIRFDNGFVLHAEASAVLHVCDPGRDIQLFGEKGGVKIGSAVEYCSIQAGMYVKSQPVGQTGFSHGDATAAEVRGFIDAIHGAPCRATAQDGVEMMQIIDAIYESARTGNQVNIR